MEYAIEFQDVTKRFGKRVALDDFSLKVPAGSLFALLGDNGAGKTTAIKSMLGFVCPDGGSVRVAGLDSRSQAQAIRQRVGYVPEQPELYKWMRVEEIGWFVAGIRQGSYLETYLRLIQEFSIPRERRISELSKGMQAKVSLALAMAHDPEILILDEPTSGLDPVVRREFLEAMVDRTASGTTVFLSSHQLHEVERVAEYVALLKGAGCCLSNGSPIFGIVRSN